MLHFELPDELYMVANGDILEDEQGGVLTVFFHRLLLLRVRCVHGAGEYFAYTAAYQIAYSSGIQGAFNLIPELYCLDFAG